jgi:nitrile hydratase accessory protein
MTFSPVGPSLLHEPLNQPDEPVFKAPWEARAFALVNQLAAAEHYSWAEWTEHLAHEIAATEPTDSQAKTYYEQWVGACETLLVAKGLLEPEAISCKMAELLAHHAVEHQH